MLLFRMTNLSNSIVAHADTLYDGIRLTNDALSIVRNLISALSQTSNYMYATTVGRCFGHHEWR
jgi:hypothetical protein